ncbi:enhancer of polycomb homolog 1-like [Daphnia carinata]|uniref:enhancer of polycomb homolog 1-like n=1 Tax=Daphnia carinata TaxID=120202 RepID=UPI00257ED8BE|nr:enhancer of polycomb homolog 1-like [Daphnia carinata]
MSTTKLSFRARALDAAKPMAVFMAHELPDLPDFTIINRAVPQMPTGMEKEEETEHHLQRAIVTGLIIPTPEVFQVDEAGCYSRCYPGEWKVPRNLIHMQPFTMEQDIPDYDMDSDDERWITSQAGKLDITPLQFEEMMDRLEKNSGQTVVTLNEAKSLLKQDNDYIIAVYDYWLNKRLKMLNPLIPQVKTEKFGGTGSSGNPYIAFRRRTEKMQTRKHRKNDEASYEKMLKLRRDLSRALSLLDMIKKREKFKREVVHFGIEVYEKRYQLSDYSGHVINELTAQVKQQPRPNSAPLSTIQSSNVWPNAIPPLTGNLPSLQRNRGRSFKDELLIRKERRNYRKRRHKNSTTRGGLATAGVPTPTASTVSASVASSVRGMSCFSDGPSASSEDEAETAAVASQSEADEAESDIEKQGPFTFRRKLHCNYLAPTQVSSPYPYHGPEDGGLTDQRFRFCLTSLATPRRRCIGLARRRVGRGGRVVLDRTSSPYDATWGSMDDRSSHQTLSEDLKEEIRTSWKHYRPSSPVEQLIESNCNDPSTNTVGSDDIHTDEKEDHYQNFDSPTVDSLFFDAGLDGFRVPPSEFSPPCVTNSNFNVIGDTASSMGKMDLDWWNYFDSVQPEDVTGEANPQELNGKKPLPSVHMNGVGSPSTATDSPFWKIPKSASLPNNDCSMVNPCLGDLHTAEDKDQSNQTVVDFLLIDSTFAMEVT